MIRIFAWLLLFSAVLSCVAELLNLQFPTVSWAFNTSHASPLLHKVIGTEGKRLAWFGYVMALFMMVAGCLILKRFAIGKELLPTTQLRLRRFRQNTRGFVSLVIIGFIVLLAGMDQLIVGKKALYVKVNGVTRFPAFERKVVLGSELNLDGDLSTSEVDYRKLKASGVGTVVLPLIPYDPTQDTAASPMVKLEEVDGLLRNVKGEPLNGRVSTLYQLDAASTHIVYEYRKGLKQGLAIGKNKNGDKVYEAYFDQGELVAGSQSYTPKMEKSLADYIGEVDPELYKIFYHAAPPMPGKGHLLGTTSEGYDVVAYLYGGLQVNIRAAIIYIPAVYMIGVFFGLIMGFFGGKFDLVFQRVIEIFSTIPFLFVVIIFSKMVPSSSRGLGMILIILIAFGWMGMTYLMRTAALKEKARDYVAAARVSGASTARIIFSHILPNTMAILVTLVPFSVSGIIMSLTALDYLGFGLPPEYATWGALLKDGLNNFSKPWLVGGAFTALVSMLILVTFVGEAVRDAFDPKKFTTYK